MQHTLPVHQVRTDTHSVEQLISSMQQTVSCDPECGGRCVVCPDTLRDQAITMLRQLMQERDQAREEFYTVGHAHASRMIAAHMAPHCAHNSVGWFERLHAFVRSLPMNSEQGMHK